ncbi:hypothetical protein E27107_140130 [Elizabethkingia anophelis]|nr:hypothetical protein E27107_140130 [Elizabethkingia anophelis]
MFLTKLKIILNYQNVIVRFFSGFISNYLCGIIFQLLIKI